MRGTGAERYLRITPQPTLPRKPHYVVRRRGDTWSVCELDAQYSIDETVLCNLPEWKARSIAATLNAKD